MPSELGDFIRASRNAVRPAITPTGSRRQVAGLRREEVAVAAGISADYYTRLEQGRELGPSPHVLDALARALQLTADGHRHLYRLAGLAPRFVRSSAKSQVSPVLRRLLDEWLHAPALVLGPGYDVLAWNTLGGALFGGFDRSANLVERVFLHPDARSFYADWDAAADGTVAGLRLQQGERPDDPRLAEVIGHLLTTSADFARIWSVNRAQSKQLHTKAFHHSEVGRVEVDMLVLDVTDGSGQELIVYLAAPGSPSQDALTLLGSLVAVDSDA